MYKHKVIFIGTPEFALPSLEKLIMADFINVELVVTQPDKPVGRRGILTPPPVKLLAQKYKIPIFQPEKILSLKSKITNLHPDLIILVSYGKIIPREILNTPKYGCLNVHPSLLPKYRGASPIQSAILNGDKETGVTIMLMDEEMDHGEVISNLKFKIEDLDTYESLSKKLAIAGANLLIKTIPGWINGEIKSKPQDHSKTTFTKIIKKQDGRIDWHNSARRIERQIRAFYPWPGTFTFWGNKRIKIISAEVLVKNFNKNLKPGEVFSSKTNEPIIVCGKNSLVIKTLQLEGKNETSGKNFLLGHKEIVGKQLN